MMDFQICNLFSMSCIYGRETRNETSKKSEDGPEYAKDRDEISGNQDETSLISKKKTKDFHPSFLYEDKVSQASIERRLNSMTKWPLNKDN